MIGDINSSIVTINKDININLLHFHVSRLAKVTKKLFFAYEFMPLTRFKKKKKKWCYWLQDLAKLLPQKWPITFPSLKANLQCHVWIIVVVEIWITWRPKSLWIPWPRSSLLWFSSVTEFYIIEWRNLLIKLLLVMDKSTSYVAVEYKLMASVRWC